MKSETKISSADKTDKSDKSDRANTTDRADETGTIDRTRMKDELGEFSKTGADSADSEDLMTLSLFKDEKKCKLT